MKNGIMAAVVGLVGALALTGGEAEAGILGTCEADIHGELFCLDGQAACIVGLQLHLCVDLCRLDLLGNVLNCALGETTCQTASGNLLACPNAPVIPDCQLDVHGEILCVDATAQCLLNAQVQLCTGDDGPSGPNDPPQPQPQPTNPGGEGYDIQFVEDEPLSGAEEWEAYGGGCSTSGSSSSWLVALGMVGIGLSRRRRRRAQALAAVGFAAMPAMASAEVNADLLRSNAIGEGGLVIEAADTLDLKEIRVSALTGYEDDPLELRNQAGDRMKLIDSQTTLDFHVGIGVGNNIELQAYLPMVIDRTSTNGMAATAIGDMAVGAKWGKRHGDYGFSFAPEVVMPTGDKFASGGSWGVNAMLAADGHFGRVTLAANVGAELRNKSEEYVGASYEQQAVFGAMADFAATKAFHVVGEAYAMRALGDSIRGNPAEALGSVRVHSGDWILMAGGGAGLSNSVGVPDWRAFIGGAYTLGSRSPKKPLPMLRTSEYAPPAAPLPAVSPEPAPAPAPAPAPEVVAVAVTDRDSDGILDDADKCPEVPETKNEFEDEDGCSDTKPVYVFTEAKALVFHDIHFETNKWRILPQSFPVLDAIASSLQAQPSVKIRIEGHTDGRGGEASNLTLSQQRALATMNYLLAAGIDASRLDYQGYGLSRPVAPNATKEGRAENRRVEIRTLSH